MGSGKRGEPNQIQKVCLAPIGRKASALAWLFKIDVDLHTGTAGKGIEYR